jgi:ubiquinone/menaquinone biosynthesis C-methylase UbiE
MGRLADKNILITGGNSGVGVAAAQEFDREGARVAVCGFNEGSLQAAKETLGAGRLAFREDVSNLTDLDRMFATIKREQADTAYKNVAPMWKSFMKLSGLEHGLREYIKRLAIELSHGATILDVGCGPGSLSFALLEKYPHAKVYATDIDPVMLKQAKQEMQSCGVTTERLVLGIAHINDPRHIRLLDGNDLELQDESIDLITAGGVLEHADWEATMPELRRLLKPKGQLVIIAMRDNFIGWICSRLYNFETETVAQLMTKVFRYGFSKVTEVPLMIAEFPANMTRQAIIAFKPYCFEGAL